MQAQHRVLDIIRRAAVVVDDGHTRNGLQKGLALHLIGAVRIDDDQKRAAVCIDKRVLTGDEHIAVLRHGAKLVNERACGIVFEIDDDAPALALFAAQTEKADRRAHRVLPQRGT